MALVPFGTSGRDGGARGVARSGRMPDRNPGSHDETREKGTAVSRPSPNGTQGQGLGLSTATPDPLRSSKGRMPKTVKANPYKGAPFDSGNGAIRGNNLGPTYRNRAPALQK